MSLGWGSIPVDAPLLTDFSSIAGTNRRPADWPGGGFASWPTVATMTSCAFCGKISEGDVPPLTWTSAVERGRTTWFCDTCSREHLRSMEAKLDSEWW